MTDANAPRRVLIIALRRIGDLLLSTPLLRSLKAAWPDSRIDVLVLPGCEDMLQGNADVHSVLVYRRDKTQFDMLRSITRRYQLAITLQPEDRAHGLAWLASGRRAGIVPIVGQPGWRWKRWLCTDTVEAQVHEIHVVEQYLRIADALGVPRLSRVIPPEPATASEISTVVGEPDSRSYVVLHPVPMYPFKEWTVTNWQALIASILRRGLRCFVTGGPSETERLQVATIVGNTQAINLAGCLSLPALVPLLRNASAFIGTDTSITHLAAACGTPTVALFGPSSPVTWGPWPKDGYREGFSPWRLRGPLQRCNNIYLIQGTHDRVGHCIPCLQEGCERHRNSRSACLDRLELDRVEAVVDEILGTC